MPLPVKKEAQLEQLRKIFCDVFDDDSLEITEKTQKSDIPGWDSVESVRITVAIEEAYDLRLNMAEVATIESVGDLLDLIPSDRESTPETESVAEHRTTTRPVPVTLAGTSTTTFLKDSLAAIGRQYGFDLDIYETEYGCFHQALLNADSDLYQHQPKFVVLHTNWRDLGLPPFSDDSTTEIDRLVDEWISLWNEIRAKSTATILQFAFDLPNHSSEGQLGWLIECGRTRSIQKLNLALAESAPDGVFFLPSPQPLANNWSDDRSWLSQRQHPSHQALSHLSDSICSAMQAAMGLTRKVLVLDLDNTLWGGVVGEVGVEGIDLGPTSAAGEAYQNFQRYAKELKQRGVLLAVCSKNDLTRAKAAFEQHESALLELSDFVDFQANWKRKSDNIRRIAENVNLGLDSFVFVDDSPNECEEVKQALPEVLTICIEGDPSDIIKKVQSTGAFEALSLSTEDKQRTDFYLQDKKRKQNAENSISYESYLSGLNMELTIAPLDKNKLKRAAQLVNKTNQFNLSLKRRTEAELEQFIHSPDRYARLVGLRDKFGDYGWVGLLLAESDGATWSIDTFIMSCRVFARGVENAMLNRIFADAREAGARSIIADYLQSGRNELVRECLLKNHFTEDRIDQERSRFHHEVSAHQPQETHFERLL